MKSLAGIFITFEGPDGAGKTSVLNAVTAALTLKLGSKIILTREPGGSVIAEDIRRVILNTENTAMDARTEALLFAASRRQHIKEVIEPALEADKVIFCDRFVDSSVAYQGAGRGIGTDAVFQMNKFAMGNVKPDLTLYFDIPSEIGLTRIQKFRENEINRLDQESLAFHQRVRQAYLELYQANPERIVLIDATPSLEEVTAQALQVILERYPELNQ